MKESETIPCKKHGILECNDEGCLWARELFGKYAGLTTDEYMKMKEQETKNGNV